MAAFDSVAFDSVAFEVDALVSLPERYAGFFRDAVWRWRRRLQRQKCSVISIAIDDNYTDGEGFVLTALALEIGRKQGLDRIPWRGGSSTTPHGTNDSGNGR
jgi:hypothetical protein